VRRFFLRRLWPLPWQAFVAHVRSLPTLRAPRWVVYTGLTLGSLGIGGALIVFLLARSSVQNLEQRYHASVSLGLVLPCGVGVCIQDTNVHFADAPGLVLEIPKIRVQLPLLRGARSVQLDGAQAVWAGAPEAVEAQARALAQTFARSLSPGSSGSKAQTAETIFLVRNASFSWQAPAGEEGVKAQGVEIEKSGGDVRMFAEQVRGSFQRRSLLLLRGRASLRREGGHTRFVSAEAHELHVESAGDALADAVSTLPAGADMPAGAAGGQSARPAGADASAEQKDSSVPEVIAPVRRGRKKGAAAQGSSKARSGGAQVTGPPAAEARAPVAGSSGGVQAPAHGLALLDKGRILRDAMPGVRAVLAQIEGLSVENAKVSIDAFYATFGQGGATVHLGPNAINAFRTPSSFRLDVTPQAAERGPAALKLGVEVPVDASADLRLSLTGGPVPLAALGLRKGDLGLLDVEHSLVEADVALRLTGDGRHASAEVDAKLHDLSVEHRALSSEPVRGAELRLRGEGELETDGSSLVVEHGELGIGRVGVSFSGALRRPEAGWALRGRVEVPVTPCQAALDALPAGLTPMIAGTRMAGTFSLTTAVDFDSSRPEDVSVHFALANGCKVTSVPAEIDVRRFKERFRRRVYGPDGERLEVEMGPGSEGWVPYGAISPFMTAAVLTTEDGGFRYHRGFDAAAIRNSIRDNLREGRFLRGASTITMQTVKNLYLEREKTLGRKIQEAVLTVYLEQELEKEQILELYFNCIEFGPMIYGVGPAAQHYFRSTPGGLSVGQALFLSSILPSPKAHHFDADGRLKAGWMSYLRKLMQIMVKRHLIDEAEMRSAAGEWLVFGEPAPVREGGLDGVDEVYPVLNGP
jgi:transglycosylase-like protein